MANRFFGMFLKFPLMMFISFLPILPLFISFVKKNHIKRKYQIFLIIYLLIDLSNNLTAIILALTTRDNIWLYNGFYFIEFASFTLLLNTVISWRKINSLVSLLLLLGIIIGIVDFSKVMISPFASSYYALIAIILVFIFFYRLLAEAKIFNLTIYPPFWMAVGIMIYSTGTFTLNLFSTYLFENLTIENFDLFFDIRRVVNVIMLLCFTYVFWLSDKKVETIEE